MKRRHRGCIRRSNPLAVFVNALREALRISPLYERDASDRRFVAQSSPRGIFGCNADGMKKRHGAT